MTSRNSPMPRDAEASLRSHAASFVSFFLLQLATFYTVIVVAFFLLHAETHGTSLSQESFAIPADYSFSLAESPGSLHRVESFSQQTFRF